MGNWNKIKKILGAFFLGGLFIAAVILFNNSYSKKEEEENKETKKYVSVKQRKGSSEMGEDVEVDDCIYNVKTAELIADYKELGSYYQNRGYISEPIEFLGENYDLGLEFPEEVKFLHLNFSLTNTGNEEIVFSPSNIMVRSKNHYRKDVHYDSEWGIINFLAYDGQYTVDGDSESDIELAGNKQGDIQESMDNDILLPEKILLQPGETLMVDFVGEFMDYMELPVSLGAGAERYDYDLYLPAYGIGIEEIQTYGETVRLNIVRSYAQADGTKKEALYNEVKNIQSMKCRSYTNLELAEHQTMRYPYTEQEKEEVQRRGETEEAGKEYLQFFCVTTGPDNVITDAYKRISKPAAFQITDWEELPQEYKEKGYLQQMAQRYQNIYGYREEELKVLLLDIVYSAETVGTLNQNEKTHQISFYENSYLYTKESDGEWKIFGTADDWRVKENSVNPKNIGWMNTQMLETGQSITVQMAYILPPELYQKYEALYFQGGWLWDYSTYDTVVPFTKIVL